MDEDEALLQPTVYTFNFRDVPLDKYIEVLDVLFHNENYQSAVEKRNRLVNSASHMRPGSSELKNIVRIIQQHDSKLAEIMYASIVMANVHSNESQDILKFTTLLKYYVDYSKEGMSERVHALSDYLFRLTFLADMLETILVNIRDDMKDVFGEKMQFQQFDSVLQVLVQLRGFFNSVRPKGENSPEDQLFVEYSDSINEYLDKRLKTYMAKMHKIRPLPRMYTAKDMVNALNHLFGSSYTFTEDCIAHTDTGGSFIASSFVLGKLNSSDARLFEGMTKNVTSKENTMEYDFDMTDIIMEAYANKNK